MSDEELIKETMSLDYSQLVMNNVYCHKEIKRLNNIIDKIEENCKWSIYSINEILTLNKICPFTKDGKILRNSYQEVRLKAFRSKCKEILKLIEESEDK